MARSKPQSYSLTRQQLVFREAAEYCGIHKGINRKGLIAKMTICIPEFFKKKREGQTTLPPSLS